MTTHTIFTTTHTLSTTTNMLGTTGTRFPDRAHNFVTFGPILCQILAAVTTNTTMFRSLKLSYSLPDHYQYYPDSADFQNVMGDPAVLHNLSDCSDRDLQIGTVWPGLKANCLHCDGNGLPYSYHIFKKNHI